MNNTKKLQLTKLGFETLQKELTELIEEKRPKLVDRLAFARSQGDLAENSDYTNAKEELEFLDGRISELEDVIKNANIVSDTLNRSEGVAGVGAKVKVRVAGKEHTYEIVGEWEADPMQKKISPESPLGRALVGKKVGEAIEVEAPAGKIAYEIVAIE